MMTEFQASRAPTELGHLHVALDGGGYDVIVGSGVIATSGIFGRLKTNRVVIITDDHVAPLHLEDLQSLLDQCSIHHDSVILPHGESSKSFEQLRSICDRLLDMRLDRQAVVLAFGGGVVGDVAGFAASIILRGLRVLQIPTTLLAQVDSAVGGKTGINAAQGKNLIGSFHQPCLVLSDLNYLKTLPQREIRAGYAEIVKYGLIADVDFFTWLETHGIKICHGETQAQCQAVLRSCRIKADIVAKDERETGIRALLNLGHTFGHALETATGYGDDLLHGEAVAIGMVMAFTLAARLGMCPAEDGRILERHLDSVGLPIRLPGHLAARLNPQNILDIMASDKKNHHGVIRFIMPEKIGRAVIRSDVPLDMVRSLLEEAAAIQYP